MRNIRVEGLQRITRDTVLNYLPVHPGQRLSSANSGEVVRKLYSTGFFSDVRLAQDGNTLVVHVTERPTIGEINISGNKLIKTKDLQAGLKQSGIAEGLVYDQSAVAAMKQALEQQYAATGRYDALVTVTATMEPRNRVAVTIEINEGRIPKVQRIEIIGNKAFSHWTLVNNFKLTTPRPWSFFTKGDDYSREKLETDLESLRTFYLDRGYIRFNINSTNVDVSKDRKKAYITLNITEGCVYTIKGFQVSGDLMGKGEQVTQLVTLRPGEVFSRREILAINDSISHYYANQGYALANVNLVPTIDDVNHQVFLTFVIKPGAPVYVRHINFVGNTKTADYVLRRETRQFEGALYSGRRVDETKRRLNNLGYLEDIKVNMQPVDNKPDQVDLNYSVKEASSATASAQVGYSDAYGFIYGANVVENNFAGTGKTVSLGFNNSQYAQTYNLGYFNPYYTPSGLSRGFNFYAQRVDPGPSVNLAAYTINSYGGMVNYRAPISEFDYLTFGYGYDYSVITDANPSIQIGNFLNQHGSHFNTTKVIGGWIHNSYDRAIFPTRGINQLVGFEVGLPFLPEALNYYKVNYDIKWYHPLYKGFILYLNGDLGYGNGYGSFDQLPFFKNYYAGGIGSVRGYAANALGPVDSQGNHIGGNFLTDASINLILPNFITNKVRTSFFVDGGNVYQNSFQLNQLRYSFGAEVDWVSPLGPLQFALAKGFNSHYPDEKQVFNFSVGTSL